MPVTVLGTEGDRNATAVSAYLPSRDDPS